MPRERRYTNVGHLEVQWAKGGTLVCIVSGEAEIETMHQFVTSDTEGRRSLDRIISALKRARRDTSGIDNARPKSG